VEAAGEKVVAVGGQGCGGRSSRGHGEGGWGKWAGRGGGGGPVGSLRGKRLLGSWRKKSWGAKAIMRLAREGRLE
jgi:hypothetical protein